MNLLNKTLIYFFLFCLISCSYDDETVLNIGILNKPLSMKSYEIRGGASTIIGHQIHRGLLTYHHETGQVISYAAKDWHYSEDYKSLIFTLNDGIKFHDGSKLNCQSVLNSFNTLIKNESFTSIKFPKSIKFRCAKNKFIMSMEKIPSTIFETLASPAASISKGENSDIGIGPYKTIKVLPHIIELENTKSPKNKLSFIIDNRDNLIKKFIDGKVDDLIYLGLFEDLNIKCQKITSYTPTTFWLNLNIAKPILNKKENRKLLQHYFLTGIEKSKIFKNENKLNGLIPYGVIGFNQEIHNLNSELTFMQIHNHLIKVTALEGKIKLTLRKVNQSMYKWEKLIQLLDPSNKIFQVEYLDNQTFFKLYYNNKLSMFFVGGNISRNDPFEVFSFFRPDDKVNPASVKKDIINKLEEKYNLTTSLIERKSLAKQANEWLLQEGYIIPLFSKKLSACVKQSISGISISPLGPLMIDYSKVKKGN